MGDVRVHRGSARPAAVGALAFTEGDEIYLAPGQDQHLPHEAWHVAQQKQGRVQPTAYAQGKAVNDDARLEREADVMGARAAGGPMPGSESSTDTRSAQRASVDAVSVVQMKKGGLGSIRIPPSQRPPRYPARVPHPRAQRPLPRAHGHPVNPAVVRAQEEYFREEARRRAAEQRAAERAAAMRAEEEASARAATAQRRTDRQVTVLEYIAEAVGTGLGVDTSDLRQSDFELLTGLQALVEQGMLAPEDIWPQFWAITSGEKRRIDQTVKE